MRSPQADLEEMLDFYQNLLWVWRLVFTSRSPKMVAQGTNFFGEPLLKDSQLVVLAKKVPWVYHRMVLGNITHTADLLSYATRGRQIPLH